MYAIASKSGALPSASSFAQRVMMSSASCAMPQTFGQKYSPDTREAIFQSAMDTHFAMIS